MMPKDTHHAMFLSFSEISDAGERLGIDECELKP